MKNSVMPSTLGIQETREKRLFTIMTIAEYDYPVLELRLLVAFEAVVDEGTFGRAATTLGYSQSTLSQQIAALERAVGGRVFDRPGGPSPVRLTALGRLVLGHARTLRSHHDAATEAVERFRAGDGRVDIGTFQTVTNVLLPPLLRRLRQERPRCEVRLVEEEIDEPNLDGLDLAFFDGRPGDGVGRLVLSDDYVLLAQAGAYPDGPVPLRVLDDLTLVALPPICDQGRVERALAGMSIVPRVVFRTVDNQAVVSMVRAGLGRAILPALAVGSAEDLDVHPLEPGLGPRQIFVHWQGTLSPLAHRVVELTEHVAAELGGPHVHPGRPVAVAKGRPPSRAEARSGPRTHPSG
jgi:DNA-binding transcriptional LysR family regulator